MIPIPPPGTKRQIHKGPAVCATRICLDGCKLAFLGVAIERGMVPNLDCTWQNGASQIADSVILSSANPNKFHIDRGALFRKKIDMAFCLWSAAAQMGNELREGLAKACRT